MKIAGRTSSRSGLLFPLAALLVCGAPALATAQPKPTEPDKQGGEEPGETPPEPGAPEPPGLPPVEPGGWGVGGKEPEGKYTPKGKTGSLREKEQEEEEARAPEGPEQLTPPGYIYVDSVVGVGSMRVVVQPNGPTELFPTGSFVIATGYRFAKMWGVGVRFGIGSAAVDGPDEPPTDVSRDRDAYKRIATGGLELSFNPYVTLQPNLHLPIGVAFTMPTQGGDMHADIDNLADRGTAIVNQAQTEVRGWEDRALFLPKRFGFTPSVGVRYDKAPLEIEGSTKVELAAKVAGNDPEEGAAAGQRPPVEANFVVNWVLSGSFYYHLFDGYLAPGARVWVAAGGMPESSDSQRFGGAQFVLEPGVKTSVPFTEDKSVGLNAGLAWVLPFSGSRGGAQAVSGENHAFAWGFRIRTGLFF